MPTTTHDTIPQTHTSDPASTHPAPTRRRPGWFLPAAVLIVAALMAGAVAGAVMLISDDGVSPEDVVVQSLEAYNERDVEALEALYAPEIVVSYDGRQVGMPFMPDDVGRTTVLDLTQEFWQGANPTLAYEVLSVDGHMVKTSATATLADGSTTRHTSFHTVSEEGLITWIHHAIHE